MSVQLRVSVSMELVSIPLGVSDANAPLTTSWTLQAEFVKVAQT